MDIFQIAPVVAVLIGLGSFFWFNHKNKKLNEKLEENFNSTADLITGLQENLPVQFAGLLSEPPETITAFLSAGSPETESEDRSMVEPIDVKENIPLLTEETREGLIGAQAVLKDFSESMNRINESNREVLKPLTDASSSFSDSLQPVIDKLSEQFEATRNIGKAIYDQTQAQNQLQVSTAHAIARNSFQYIIDTLRSFVVSYEKHMDGSASLEISDVVDTLFDDADLRIEGKFEIPDGSYWLITARRVRVAPSLSAPFIRIILRETSGKGSYEDVGDFHVRFALDGSQFFVRLQDDFKTVYGDGSFSKPIAEFQSTLLDLLRQLFEAQIHKMT